MDKGKGNSRAVELAKDVLIVLLICSALWLAGRSQLLRSKSGQSLTVNTVQTETGARVDGARPLRMTANLPGNDELVRYGVQYNAEASDALFHQVAGLLVEALSSAGGEERVTRAQWERAQKTAPGFSFDFQGALPLSVLIGWLSGEEGDGEAAIRRLTVTVWEDRVALYYRDEESGLYFRRLSQVVSADQLAEVLSGLDGNGAKYAFESELYRNLDRDTLVLGETPAPVVYLADNPVAGGRSSLEALMGDLGISLDASSFYSSGNEEVARSGNDNIRLSDGGLLMYQAGENSAHFQIPARHESPTLFETVETCRQLAAATVGARCGAARLYLMSARQTEEGLEVRFGYCLNGAVVRTGAACAARFLARGGRIDQFELYFRHYTDSGERTVILPVRQAVAAMEAMDLKGEELLLTYQDNGGASVTATWTAAGEER